MSKYNVDEVIKNILDADDDKWIPSDKIPLISKELDILKADLKSYLFNSNYNMIELTNESDDICKKGKMLIGEREKYVKEIEQVTMTEILKSIEDYENLLEELERVKYAADVVSDVVESGKFIKEFNDGTEAQSYIQAVEAVNNLIQLLESPTEGYPDLDVYHHTKKTAQVLQDKLMQDLQEDWSKMIIWSTVKDSHSTTITIKFSVNDTQRCAQVLLALDKSNKLEEKLSEFSKFLLDEVLQPILHNDCTVYAETDSLVTITIMPREDYNPSYDLVISNLRLLFHFLGNKMNLDYIRGKTLMTMMGKQISVKFATMLTKECLIETIPNNINELQNYDRVTLAIEDFQRFLYLVRFFNVEDNISILTYIANIDFLFANKCSLYFLETARSIMLKDLSQTMSIGVNNIMEHEEHMGSNVSTQGLSGLQEAMNVFDETLPKSLFYFPRCMISKSAQELLDLAYGMMEQGVQCSDIVCKKLYNATRLVFELYEAVVPYHHENYLQNIPQYVALFHNNCMYLAHNLLTFGDKWVILMEGRQLEYPISFVDLVQKLRDLGYKHLTVHMQQQRKQILDNIRSSELNSMSVAEELGGGAEAAVRQCLRQLHLLKNVWIGVLPHNVFTKLMCTLVNMFLEELIHRVCTVEDISMAMAAQLSDLYTLVVQKTPQLFQDPSDAEKHVKSWLKIQELIFVLGGSLMDIDSHWQDGAGPLAMHFRPDELRNLIKALFQNTQIRANLLSKIK